MTCELTGGAHILTSRVAQGLCPHRELSLSPFSFFLPLSPVYSVHGPSICLLCRLLSFVLAGQLKSAMDVRKLEGQIIGLLTIQPLPSFFFNFLSVMIVLLLVVGNFQVGNFKLDFCPVVGFCFGGPRHFGRFRRRNELICAKGGTEGTGHRRLYLSRSEVRHSQLQSPWPVFIYLQN